MIERLDRFRDSINAKQIERSLLYAFIISLAFPIKINTSITISFVAFVVFRHGILFFIDSLKQSRLLQVLLIYLLFAIGGALRPDAIASFGSIVERKAAIFFIPLVFTAIMLDKGEQKRIFFLFIFSVLIACVYSLFITYYHTHNSDLYTFSFSLVEYAIIPSNYLALFVGMALLIIYDRLKEWILPEQVLMGFTAIVLVATLGMMGTRAPLLSLFLIIGFAAFIQVVRTRNVNGILLIGLMLMCGLFLVKFLPALNQRVEVLFRLGAEGDWRYYEFSSAWNAIQKNPIWGWGFNGAEQQLVKEYERIGWPEGIQYRFNAHNQILQTTLEQGAVGLVALLMVYVMTFYTAIKKGGFLGWSFVLFFALCSLTEAVLYRNKGIMFYAAFCGFLLMTKRDSN